MVIKKLKSTWGRGKSKQYLCEGRIGKYAWYPSSQSSSTYGDVVLAKFATKQEGLKAAHDASAKPDKCEFIAERIPC